MFPVNSHIMKKALFITCILSIIGYCAYAQKPVRRVPDGSTDIPPIVQPGDAFLGDWEWSNGGEVFHISLQRDPALPIPRDPQHGTINAIFGDYMYSRNGIIINQSSGAKPFPKGLFFATLGVTKMDFRFYDQASGKAGRATLEFVAGNRNQITWRLHKVEQTYFGQASVPPPNFSVPTAVTMIRR
jgi:hypothetical protein